jgi:transposase
LFASLYEELLQLDEKIYAINEQMQSVYRTSEPCRRVAAVEGIGPLTTSALVAAMSDGKAFKNRSSVCGLVSLGTEAAF